MPCRWENDVSKKFLDVCRARNPDKLEALTRDPANAWRSGDWQKGLLVSIQCIGHKQRFIGAGLILNDSPRSNWSRHQGAQLRRTENRNEVNLVVHASKHSWRTLIHPKCTSATRKKGGNSTKCHLANIMQILSKLQTSWEISSSSRRWR